MERKGCVFEKHVAKMQQWKERSSQPCRSPEASLPEPDLQRQVWFRWLLRKPRDRPGLSLLFCSLLTPHCSHPSLFTPLTVHTLTVHTPVYTYHYSHPSLFTHSSHPTVHTPHCSHPLLFTPSPHSGCSATTSGAKAFCRSARDQSSVWDPFMTEVSQQSQHGQGPGLG